MKYEILAPGKEKASYITEGIEEFLKRLRHYADVQVKNVKVKKQQGNAEQMRAKEAEILLNNLAPSAFAVALDAQGRQYDSMAFSALIDTWENSGIRHVAFVIGGPMGLADEVLQRAQLKLALSRMTFTHDMVRLFLLEQLYRAYTIKAGEKYHK